ncbi:MAG: hypothetical protein AMXMBFR61_25160 [Fimbriimonadales bacterium]
MKRHIATLLVLLSLSVSALSQVGREANLHTKQEFEKLIGEVKKLADDRGWDIEKHAIHWVIAYTPAGANRDARSCDAMRSLITELKKTKWWFADNKAEDRMSIVPYQLYVREKDVLGELGGKDKKISAPTRSRESDPVVKYPVGEDNYDGGHDMERAAIWALERLRGTKDWVLLVLSNTPSSNTPTNDPSFPLVGDRSPQYLEALKSSGIASEESVQPVHLFELNGDEKHWLVSVDIYMPDKPSSPGFEADRRTPPGGSSGSKGDETNDGNGGKGGNGPSWLWLWILVAAVTLVTCGGAVVFYYWPVDVACGGTTAQRLRPHFRGLLAVYGPDTEPTMAPNVVLPKKGPYTRLSGAQLLNIVASGFRRIRVEGVSVSVLDASSGEPPRTLGKGVHSLQLQSHLDPSATAVPLELQVL